MDIEMEADGGLKSKEILFEKDIWFYREVLCNDSW